MVAQNVVNYVAIVDVDNADLKLRPGMTANASVTTARRENVVRLPNAALRFRPPEGAAVEPPEDAPGGERKRPEGTRAGKHGEWRDRAHREDPGSGDASRKPVYVLDEKGGLRLQRVELGITDGAWTEVSGSELKEGDRIVTGFQTASDKEQKSNSGASSPFMPRHPGGPGR
jgi:HlyD family secretion protein